MFPGNFKVKDIKERCKWKAYKIIYTSCLENVVKGNYAFEYGKMSQFNKKLVFLAYFKDKAQMDVAIARDTKYSKGLILDYSWKEKRVWEYAG